MVYTRHRSSGPGRKMSQASGTSLHVIVVYITSYLLLKTCDLNYRLSEMCVYSCICMQNIGSHLYISSCNACIYVMNQQFGHLSICIY